MTSGPKELAPPLSIYLPGRLSESCVDAPLDAMANTPFDQMSARTKLFAGIGQPRVLVAESGADMRLHLDRLLRKEGYEVLSIADGETALMAIRRQKPDLVFAEVNPTQRHGLGPLSVLAREPMPIIALSTSASGEARAACLRAGADDYLVMPCSAGDLLARVEARLALSRFHATSVAEMSRLYGFSCWLTAISELPALLQEVLSSTIELLGADFGTIQLYDPETRSLHIAAQQGFGVGFLEYFRDVTIDTDSTSARVLNEGTPIVIEDVTLDAEFVLHRHIAASAGFRAVQLLPLTERSSGCLIGVLSTHFRDPGRPGDRALRWADLYALQAGDIIALRISEQRLRESEARLQTAVHLVGLSLYTWYPLTGAVCWDANIKAMWGLPPAAEVNHAVFLAGIHADDRPRVNAAITRAIDPAGDGLYKVEYRVNGIGDGVERWVSARGRTFFDDGRPVRHLGAVRDITERKRAEKRAAADGKRAEIAWRKTEECCRKFAKHSTDVLRSVDLGTLRHVFISAAFEQVWGLPISKLWDARNWIHSVHQADRERVISAFERVQQGEDLRLEYRIVRPDGRVRRIRDTMFAIRDEYGRVGSIGGSAQDITLNSGSLIYLVDADPISCTEVAEMLQDAGYDVKIFPSGRDFLRIAPVLVPGCVVVNIRRLEVDDLAIPRELQARRRELPVIMVGDSGCDLRLGVRAMKAGAADFLSTPCRHEDLLAAIATELADILEGTARDREAELAKASVAAMSRREREVLVGMLGGGTSKSIAKELKISPRTVEMHRAHVMERLGAKTLAELVLRAAAGGLRPPAARGRGFVMGGAGVKTTSSEG
jgi:PAS domain S-box-containing protein